VVATDRDRGPLLIGQSQAVHHSKQPPLRQRNSVPSIRSFDLTDQDCPHNRTRADQGTDHRRPQGRAPAANGERKSSVTQPRSSKPRRCTTPATTPSSRSPRPSKPPGPRSTGHLTPSRSEPSRGYGDVGSQADNRVRRALKCGGW
jgi:hypothetical protein